MKRTLTTIIVFVACASAAAQSAAYEKVRADAKDGTSVVILATDKPEVGEETLTWRYQIRNDSTQDIWICDYLGPTGYEAHLAQDGNTLLIHRRLDLPQIRFTMGLQPHGKYDRLRPGEVRTERMSFPLPILPHYVFSKSRDEGAREHATRLVLEIGYYVGDLRAIVFDALRHEEMTARPVPPNATPEQLGVLYYIKGPLSFLRMNESSPNPSEYLEIPYTWQALEGERVLRLAADDVRIPYLERDRPVAHPDLMHCTRIEVKLKESAPGFFFPRADEQSILSPAEEEYLQSLGTIVVTDQQLLKAIANEIAQGLRDAFVTEHGIAELTSYRADERVASFTVYDGLYTVTEKGQVFRSTAGRRFRGVWGNTYDPRHTKGLPHIMRRLTPQLRSFDLRLQCMNHLEQLWLRFDTYHKTKAYPAASRWCDDIVDALRSNGWQEKQVMEPFKCPGKERGRCHYAMNPKCEINSSPDMVLLFEAKAGWNRHGGPELFTFDNHDPRGGFVLLNGGTVKFVRTEEELSQLRWK
jgi:hypothetical protein